ncbi:P-loop containing nucleoside triphosphate hydrolase protein [Rhodocollybia butyracea]|uniref:Iron-sulfur clusters transporter ATM1, mitochondrial n=1 Tax=Rhodocollybia butyracea TaxID=206335 RepID=A0A9P5PFV7_9AGAR|nr:P-loop containing nucleoside triphosphate hydrolase protein [Rhodocollybia butyracea]
MRCILLIDNILGSQDLKIQVPLIFKQIIDSLNLPLDLSSNVTVWTIVGATILGYSLVHIGAMVFGDSLNAVFAHIGQRAIRQFARETFHEIPSRRTDWWSDRHCLFRIAPTRLEISMVYGILTYKFTSDCAAITAGTLAAYASFTIRTTSWRTQFRHHANKTDQRVAVIFSSALTMTMLMAAQRVYKRYKDTNQSSDSPWLSTSFHGEPQQNVLDMEVLFNLRENNLSKTHHTPIRPIFNLLVQDIQFKNVNFVYNPSCSIFSDLSFTIPARKHTAIVGPSGCGKSTILTLLFSFYDFSSEKISFGDQNVAQVQLASLRHDIGVSDPMEAADRANAHEVILSLTEGYRTKVVGEKQRLAVAKVLLKEPPMFFDEATSALDAHTEAELMYNTDNALLRESCTGVFADLIVVLQEGRVVS